MPQPIGGEVEKNKWRDASLDAPPTPLLLYYNVCTPFIPRVKRERD